MSQDFGFNHVNLKDIDPNRKPVEEGFYTLQLVKSEVREYEIADTYKSGPKEGEPREDATSVTGVKGSFLNLQFAISDHPEHSGRRLFLTLFPGDNTFKQLRKMMDATQEEMLDSETIPQYLERVADLNPPATFKAFVNKREGKDRDGNPETKNNVNLWQAQVV